jgi:hypothetical protein
MTQPDQVTYIFYSGVLGVLGWIGRSLMHLVKEVKAVSLIVRTCPNCRDTVTRINEADTHL